METPRTQSLEPKSEGFKDIIDSEVNPFLEQITLRSQIVLKRFKRGEAVIPNSPDVNVEEVENLTKQNSELNTRGIGMGRLKQKQIASFVLLYTDQKIDYRNLSSVSVKTILYIIYEKLNLGCDYIILSPKELNEILKLSKKNSYDVFVELVNNKIIYKRNDNVWWINPNYFYAGNRLKILTK